MKHLDISPVGRAASHKLIRQYLHNHYHPEVRKEICGDHFVEQSELQWYVQAAYRHLKISGPHQEDANKFLKGKMIVEHLFVPTVNSLIFEEMHPQYPQLETIVHCISFDTGKISRIDVPGARIRGVRTNTTELLVQVDPAWDWYLFDLPEGNMRKVCTYSSDFYLSADGNYFFPVEHSSTIRLVDLETGVQLDAKNKRHFSRYATRVKIITVIHFDPEQPALYALLSRNPELSFAAMKNDVCLQLMVTE